MLVEIEPLRFHPRRINGRKFDANVPLSILHNLAHFVLCMPFQNDFQSLQPRCLQGSVQSHTIRGVSRRIEGERRSSYSLQASQRQAAWFRQAHPRITWDDRFDAADISVGLRCSILDVLISMLMSLRNLPRFFLTASASSNRRGGLPRRSGIVSSAHRILRIFWPDCYSRPPHCLRLRPYRRCTGSARGMEQEAGPFWGSSNWYGPRQ